MHAFSRFEQAMWACVALGVLAVAQAGCESKQALAPVTGKVTHAGQPLAGANVMFQPEQGIASGATTGDDGRFQLQVQTSNDRRTGAVPGKHRVSILKPGVEPPPPMGGSAQPPPPPQPPLELHTEVEVNASGPNDFTFDIP